jgi:cardiolipin synthase
VTTVSTRVWTIPNLLSLFRLLLIPVFLVLLVNRLYLWALLVLVISSLTDFVDGYVARHFNQVSRVGQLLDPAADRLFIFSTLIGLAWTGFIPWWLAGVIFARELLLLIVGVMLANHGYGPLPVHHLGKMGTFALLTAMPRLGRRPLGRVPVLVGGHPLRAAGGQADPDSGGCARHLIR